MKRPLWLEAAAQIALWIDQIHQVKAEFKLALLAVVLGVALLFVATVQAEPNDLIISGARLGFILLVGSLYLAIYPYADFVSNRLFQQGFQATVLGLAFASAIVVGYGLLVGWQVHQLINNDLLTARSGMTLSLAFASLLFALQHWAEIKHESTNKNLTLG